MINHKSDETIAAIDRIRAQPGQSGVKIEAVMCDLGLLKDIQKVCEEQAKKLDRLDLVRFRLLFLFLLPLVPLLLDNALPRLVHIVLHFRPTLFNTFSFSFFSLFELCKRR